MVYLIPRNQTEFFKLLFNKNVCFCSFTVGLLKYQTNKPKTYRGMYSDWLLYSLNHPNLQTLNLQDVRRSISKQSAHLQSVNPVNIWAKEAMIAGSKAVFLKSHPLHFVYVVSCNGPDQLCLSIFTVCSYSKIAAFALMSSACRCCGLPCCFYPQPHAFVYRQVEMTVTSCIWPQPMSSYTYTHSQSLCKLYAGLILSISPSAFHLSPQIYCPHYL